jgi:ribose-phosphate pyrophosphokinase
MSDSDLALFALNATRPFAERVAARLGRQLSAHEEQEFEDGEHKTRPLESVRGRNCYVVQSLHGARSRVSTTSCAGSCSSWARSRMRPPRA